MKFEANISERVSNDSSLEFELSGEALKTISTDDNDNEQQELIDATVSIIKKHPKAVWIKGSVTIQFFTNAKDLKDTIKTIMKERG
jgi:hypothetical protein